MCLIVFACSLVYLLGDLLVEIIRMIRNKSFLINILIAIHVNAVSKIVGCQ